MKKLFFVVFLLTAILSIVPPVLAQSNFRNSEVSNLSKKEIINKDYFATGDKVTISGVVNGDAYVAGGNINVVGVVNGDLLVAGGDININGNVTGDVRAVGGNIQINGTVGGNVTTLGGTVRIDDNSHISGSLVMGAGNIEVFGPIGKGITVGGGSLLIGNTVGADVYAAVEELDLAANAQIGGELNYISEKQANVAEGASASRGIKHQLPPKDADEKDKNQFLAGVDVGWVVFNFLSLLLIGLLLLWALPGFMQKAAESLTEKPLQSLGIGFLTLILTPIAAAILMITLIGLPLGLILLVGYFFLLYIAKVFVTLAIGERILDKKKSRYWSMALGALIISLLGILPLIGGIVEFLALLLGLGAYVMTKKSVFQNLRLKKLL